MQDVKVICKTTSVASTRLFGLTIYNLVCQSIKDNSLYDKFYEMQ